MNSLVILIVAANAGFQTVPTDSLVADTIKPEPSKFVQDTPRIMAERNPALNDELRGDIMMARKLYRDAIDFYKPTAGKNPVMANKTGIAYHQMGDLENAKKYYERFLAAYDAETKSTKGEYKDHGQILPVLRKDAENFVK